METIKRTLTSARTLLTSTGLLAVLCVVSATLALIQSARVESLRTTWEKENSKTDHALEQMHSMGYESGYQSAVVDSYTESPRYLIEEETSGQPVMWKKIAIDSSNQTALDSHRSSLASAQ